MVALPYLPYARGTWGAAARVVQHALLHLYGPESATFSCPVAMADGAAALLSLPEVDAGGAGRVAAPADLHRPGHRDHQRAVDDRVAGRLRPVPLEHRRAAAPADGSWRLTGEKWFCSAADAAMAVALARPEGAGRGSRVLAPFLVPRYAADSPLGATGSAPDAPAPGVTVHRLKDKLGTRALPTAEIGLRRRVRACRWVTRRCPGLARAMTLVVVTRVHNAAAAAARDAARTGLRPRLRHVPARRRRRVGRTRRCTGPPWAPWPSTRPGRSRWPGTRSRCWGGSEVGADPEAAAELRLVAPLAKLATGRLAVAAAAEYVECFGGAGYVEDTGVPRLLRDAQVLPIWEGTTNVLALDVLRAVGTGGRRRAAAGPARHAAAAAEPQSADVLAGVTQRLRADLAAVTGAAVAGARSLALRMAYALTAALLVEQAGADERSAVAARLWIQRRLAGAEIDVAAARDFGRLC